MTKITFYQRVDGTFQGFHSQDHAGYSAEGQDIVCAAVSALVINFVNSLDELTDDHYQIDVNQVRSQKSLQMLWDQDVHWHFICMYYHAKDYISIRHMQQQLCYF